jgi:hypothetical protein
MDIINLVNENQGVVSTIGVFVALISLFGCTYVFNKKTKKTMKQTSGNNSTNYQSGRDIHIKND